MARNPLAWLNDLLRRRLGATGQGAAVIMLATVAAQAVALLGYPIITRLYTPDDFGTLATVMAASLLLMPLMAIRADSLVPLPRSDDLSRRIIRRGVRALVVNTLVVAAVVTTLFTTGHHFDLGVWIFAIPAAAALLALFQLANAWAIRRRHYSTIAGRNIVQALVTIAIQTAVGLLAVGALGLIAGYVLGLLLSTLFLAVTNRSGTDSATAPAADEAPSARSAPTEDSGVAPAEPGDQPASPEVSSPAQPEDLRTYTRQGPALSLAGVLNAAGLYTPPLLLTTFYGLAAAGQFGLAQRVIAIPVALLGQATAQVYLGWLSENKRSGGTDALVALKKATRLLLVAAAPMSLIVLLAAPWAFPLLFGERWVDAGSMAAALSINLGAQLVAAPLSQTLIVLGHARLQLAWDATRLALVVGSLLACVFFEVSAVSAVWAFSMASAAAYVLSWILSRWVAARAAPGAPSPGSAAAHP